jgi:hypothetical protein
VTSTARSRGELLGGLVAALFCAACADLGEETGGPPREGAPPDTVRLEPDRDNTLYEHRNGSLSNGAGRAFFAGTNGGGGLRRGLVRFDVASALPEGAVVESAWLELECSRVSNAVARTVSLHRVTASWGEGASDVPDGPGDGMGEGQGTKSAAGDATWIHREFDTLFWSSPGGDFESAPSASAAVSGLDRYRWGATAAMTADVQAWADDPAANHGWLLLGDETANATAKQFDSREHVVVSTRPSLTIVYAAPDGAAVTPSASPRAGRSRRNGSSGRAPPRAPRCEEAS